MNNNNVIESFLSTVIIFGEIQSSNNYFLKLMKCTVVQENLVSVQKFDFHSSGNYG